MDHILKYPCFTEDSKNLLLHGLCVLVGVHSSRILYFLRASTFFFIDWFNLLMIKKKLLKTLYDCFLLKIESTNSLNTLIGLLLVFIF